MQNLRLGSRGPDVTRLQQKLAELGFDPKGVDGVFGSDTEGALKRFQQNSGLAVNGIADESTFNALHLDVAPVAPSITASVTPTIVARMFPTATPLKNIQNNLPFVLSALDEAELGDKNMVLMALGTIRAESEGFVPIDEGKSKFNTSPGGRPFDKYDNRKDLGNTGIPDGERYKGRGFIQLTGRSNYRTIGKDIGLGTELEANPLLANEPDVAGRILAFFLKRVEMQIRQALASSDLAKARKLVNGGSHGLDRFTDTFNKGKALLG
jgi:putative chitinase